MSDLFTYSHGNASTPAKLTIPGKNGDLVVSGEPARRTHDRIMQTPDGEERQDLVRKLYRGVKG